MAADLWEMQENQYVSEILIDKLEFSSQKLLSLHELLLSVSHP